MSKSIEPPTFKKPVSAILKEKLLFIEEILEISSALLLLISCILKQIPANFSKILHIPQINILETYFTSLNLCKNTFFSIQIKNKHILDYLFCSTLEVVVECLNQNYNQQARELTFLENSSFLLIILKSFKFLERIEHKLFVLEVLIVFFRVSEYLHSSEPKCIHFMANHCEEEDIQILLSEVFEFLENTKHQKLMSKYAFFKNNFFEIGEN